MAVPFNRKKIKVGLELTSRCNLRCGMCPLPVLRRPYEDMEWWLVEKAEREIHGMGLGLKWLHEMGEPLLYERIDDAIRLFPEASLSTNGVLLTEEIGQRILDAGLKRLRICLDSVNEDVYPHLRTGGDWGVVVERTREFLELARDHPIRIEIQKMRSRMTLDETVEEFRDLFNLKKYRNARIIEKTCEGLDVNEETDLHGKFVRRIYADGRVTHCCYDAHGDQVVGDLREQTLPEIIESERFEKMYQAFRAGDLSELPRCAECFKHGSDSSTINTVVQKLPEGAKDLVRKVIDLRYR